MFTLQKKYFYQWISSGFIFITVLLPLHANLTLTPPIEKYILQLEKKYHFNKTRLTSTLKKATIQPKVLKAIQQPSEKKPWYVYKNIFLTHKRIKQGVAFWQKHEKTLARAEKIYGVPAQIIVAILGVETFYGKYIGKFRVLDSLVTLAFNYPKRSKFFKQELTAYLQLIEKNKIAPLSLKGSYAGAIGLPQFIPSSINHYAIDFNQDGKINLQTSTEDAIGSIANYFKRHGWKKEAPILSPAKVINSNYLTLYKKQRKKPSFTLEQWKKNGLTPINLPKNKNQNALLISLATNKLGKKNKFWLGYNNFYVITRYNHSILYAMAVYQLSDEITKMKKMNSIHT